MQQVERKNIKILGKRVKDLRIEKSKSLNEFVLSRGFLTTATWSRVENGLFDLKFSTLLKIAKMLEVDVAELLNGCDFDYDFDED